MRAFRWMSSNSPAKISYNILLYIYNYANAWTIKKLLPSFLVITSLHGINNDWSIQTSLREQATCFAVQQHFPEANSEFEENEEMLNSEMEGGRVGDKLLWFCFLELFFGHWLWVRAEASELQKC